MRNQYVTKSIHRRRLASVKQAAVIAVLSACSAAGIIAGGTFGWIAGKAMSAPSHVELIAIDSNGDSYVAGSGSTCGEAAINAQWPLNTVTIYCPR